jgi:hypothetical protein
LLNKEGGLVYNWFNTGVGLQAVPTQPGTIVAAVTSDNNKKNDKR